MSIPPLFSIIIPCYNQGIFLHDCLSSLINQTYRNWEAIVVNDGSQDNTQQIAEEYALRDNRIWLLNKENGGLSSARNRGIEEAQGQWFIFLDSDDFLYPDCLQQLFNFAVNEGSNVLIRYGYSYVSQSEKEVIHTVLPPDETEMIPSVFYSVPGPCHTICINRELVYNIGFFDHSLRALEDWDFWIRAAKAGGKFINISAPLAFYRQVDGSMSRDVEAMYQSGKTVIERIPLKDNRVKVDSVNNTNIDFNIQPVLKRLFVRILGVSVFQGDMKKSIDFYKSGATKEEFDFEPADFSEMSSSLTFRYWRDKKAVNQLLDNIRPVYNDFFVKVGFSKRFIKEALYFVFLKQLMLRNHMKYGPVLSKPVNMLLRNFYG